jgi:nicotinate-nucleotide adenylyltransferase
MGVKMSNELWADRTVGLLGGSFNPAHEGHLHISLQAIKSLGLDAVWWMVSPQNPLKSARDMAPLSKRLDYARGVAQHPKIHVTDIERQLGTQYTLDTIRALQQRFPRTTFIWLMGADNLANCHHWKNWQEIFKALPVCVLDRPPRHGSLRAVPAMERFRQYKIPQEQAFRLKGMGAPAWVMVRMPLNALSATAIRNRRK